MKLHVGAHTSRVDHWDRHSVYRDCSFPGSIVLGVWGIPWFHSIRYKIKKKKKKNVFENSRIEQKKFNLYLTRARFSINVKKNSFSWHLSFQKNVISLYFLAPRFFTSCFRHCCKIFGGFLQ